ncbi:MAG TPA: class I SAM-dependent methyltransferase [Patescibacteria group bacterium]|nr:class I SAM-dependent methyltransferase [Patescibacteria group bacterium]
MHIKQTDLVLEVGSGNSPRYRSNVIADRLLHDNSQRAGTFSIVIDRPFIVCDGYNLPFKDNTFNYVICSHVLEHLDNPDAFIKELMRVGKRGYIEVPSILGERLFGWDFHLWYCEFKNNILVMTRKKEGKRFDGFFHRLIANDISFRRFCEMHENDFYIKYEWDKKVSLQVNRKEKSQKEIEEVDKTLWELVNTMQWSITRDVLFYFSWMTRRVKRKSIKIARRVSWNFSKMLIQRKIINYLLPLLLCPTCHRDGVIYKQGTIVCTSCKHVYSIDHCLPILLTIDEERKGY